MRSESTELFRCLRAMAVDGSVGEIAEIQSTDGVEKLDELFVALSNGGAKVGTVQPNSAAAKAKVKVDDVIVAVDDKKIKDSKALIELIGKRKADEKVVLDSDFNDEPLAEFAPGTFFGIVTLPTMAVLNTTTPTKLSLACVAYFNTGGASVVATKWAISALQTSSNG